MRVILCHDVKKEGVCIVVKRLVIEEQLSQKAEVLSIQLTRGAEGEEGEERGK